MRDFSLKMLKELLWSFKKTDYNIYPFKEYWKQKIEIDRLERVCLLRHDVDRCPRMALNVAKMEKALGIQGTFFFRIKSMVFNPDIIKAIASLGHEIGYHYETLADSHGNFEQSFQLFSGNLERLRQLAEVVSAAMHSRPFSKWDNRLFWNKYSLEQFDLLGETYLSVDHRRYVYLADSGRNWNGNRNVVWDKVNGTNPPEIRDGTKGLIKLIKAGKLKNIHLLIHPNRWPNSLAIESFSFLFDKSINLVKSTVKLIGNKESYLR